MMVKLNLWPILFIVICTYVQNSVGNPQLKSVVVLFRHGDKTPTTSFPKDPYFQEQYWPMGFGELTNKGKLRHYNLGKWLRKRYDSFLSDVYTRKEIYVFSSDKDRTLMSAEANLAGLFPPKSNQIWTENLLWQPIPIHTVAVKEDSIMRMSKSCPRFTHLFNEVYNSSYYKNLSVQYVEVYESLSNLTGWKVDDVHHFAQLLSALHCYSSYNKSYLPGWVTQLDYNLLNHLAGLHYARHTSTKDMKRLRVGPFFNRLFTHFDDIIRNVKDEPKFLMYSGHEDTVASVLNGMGLFDLVPPGFASAVIWELWSTSPTGFYVNLLYKRTETMNILYKKTESVTVNKLMVDGCSFDCEYYRLKTILKPITVDASTWEKECKLQDFSTNLKPVTPLSSSF